MQPNISQFIEFIKESALVDEEKNILIEKLSSEDMSLEEKERFISDFLSNKVATLNAEEIAELKPIYEEAEKEILEAEEETRKQLAQLEEEKDQIIVQAEQEMERIED